MQFYKISELYNRAGKWTTKAQQAAAKGKYNKAGEYRTKALKLVAQAKEIESRVQA